MKLSVYEAAKKVGVLPPAVYDWIKRGLKHSFEYRGTRKIIRIREEDLMAYLREKRGEE